MGKLDERCLILNRSWVPIQTCSVRRAISLVFQDVAKIVDSDTATYDFADWYEYSQYEEQDEKNYIHTSNSKFLVPKVIVLREFNKVPFPRNSFSRKKIYERDNYSCQYCGNQRGSKNAKLSIDHIIPKSKGGQSTWENVVAACLKCNNKKSDSLLEDLGWKLLKKPVRPKNHVVDGKLQREWKKFLS